MPSSDLFNTEAESFWLASVLRNPSEYYSLNDIGLKPDDFIGIDNKRVMKAIVESVTDHKEPNLPFVLESLRLEGHDETCEFVSGLTSLPCSIPQALDYAKTVRALSFSRDLTYAGAKFIEIGREHRSKVEDAQSEAEKVYRKAMSSFPEAERSPKPGDIIRRIKTAGPAEAIPIKFSPTLQTVIGGLHPGHLIVAGGFSSVGKSMFAMNIVSDALDARGKHIAIISSEMTQEQNLIRLLSLRSGVSQQNIRDNITIGLGEQQALLKAQAELERSNLLVYDTLSYMPAIRNELVKLKNRDGLDLVVLDYLQAISVSGKEVEDAREIVLEAQRIAKELSCCVLALSQISNSMAQEDIATGGKGDYYAFRASGAIKDAADAAIYLRRDRRSQSPILKVEIAKHRHGELGNFECRADLKTGKLTEIEEYFEEDDDE